MKWKLFSGKRISAIGIFRIILVILGVIIVLFNDTLGKIEGFIEFLLIYFILVIIAVAHWLFVNIRFLIHLKKQVYKMVSKGRLLVGILKN